jgi:hypothetical protein
MAEGKAPEVQIVGHPQSGLPETARIPPVSIAPDYSITHATREPSLESVA